MMVLSVALDEMPMIVTTMYDMMGRAKSSYMMRLTVWARMPARMYVPASIAATTVPWPATAPPVVTSIRGPPSGVQGHISWILCIKARVVSPPTSTRVRCWSTLGVQTICLQLAAPDACEVITKKACLMHSAEAALNRRICCVRYMSGRRCLLDRRYFFIWTRVV